MNSRTCSKLHALEFLRKYLVGLVKRTVVVFDDVQHKRHDNEYALAVGTAPRHVFLYGNGNETTFASALFLHVNRRDGRFRSIVSDDLNYNVPFLYRGGDVEGEGDRVMDSVFDAVNRQLVRAELAHETRDPDAWSVVVRAYMESAPPDELAASAAGSKKSRRTRTSA